jgi:hypothetical protein
MNDKNIYGNLNTDQDIIKFGSYLNRKLLDYDLVLLVKEVLRERKEVKREICEYINNQET